MKFLLDTCVLSEIRKSEGLDAVKDFVDGLDSRDIKLSVITIGEIQKGISLLPEGAKKYALSQWLDNLEAHYMDAILPIDMAVVKIWGELTARVQRAGRVLPVSDGLIAASCVAHNLELVTRNEKDFQGTGVVVQNPWND